MFYAVLVVARAGKVSPVCALVDVSWEGRLPVLLYPYVCPLLTLAPNSTFGAYVKLACCVEGAVSCRMSVGLPEEVPYVSAV